MCERELETEQNCNILTPHSIGLNRVSFPFSGADQLGAWGPSLSGCWFSLRHLISNSSDPQLIWSPTDLLPNCNCSRAHSAGCWLSLLHLGSNSFDHQLIHFLSPPGLYNSSTSNFFLWATQSRSFNPSTVKAIISRYSSTGCTCYLYRCISYFDNPAGSEVNMQKIDKILPLIFDKLKCLDRE